MNPPHGECVEQFNAERGKACWVALIAVVGITFFVLHASRPIGPVHWMGIVGGVGMLLFSIVQLLPGAMCLRVCEDGINIRTIYISQFFIGWESIQGFGVKEERYGSRVVMRVDPALRVGRKTVLYFHYHMAAEALADRLADFKEQCSPASVAEPVQ